MKIGFIGTGNITSAVVEGLCTATDAPSKIMLSPRNAEKARRLAQRFEPVVVAKNNQEVIDKSEIVFIALRPNVAEEILKELRFHPEQLILSLIPTYPLVKLRSLVSPASHIVRAVPLPPVAKHHGPVIFYPDDKKAYHIFKRIGNPLAVPDEKQLHVLWTMTGLISPYFALLEETHHWAVKNGVDKDISERYTAWMFQALSDMAVNQENSDFSEMAKEAATPGGLNEQAVKYIREQGAYHSFNEALDQIILRFGEEPAKD